MANPWYSYKGVPYKGTTPAFFDINSCEWGQYLISNKEKIKEFALQFLQKKDIIKEQYFNKELVEGTSKWELTSFLFWDLPSKKNIKIGSDFFNLFSSIKEITSLSISILPPNTSIKAHYGDTDAVCRIHIPVQVPDGLPDCGLKVDAKSVGWNDIIVFSDAHLHEAWNRTNEYRVVVILDILLPEYLNQKNKVCNNVRSLLRLQNAIAKMPFLNALPGFVKGGLRYGYKTFIYLGI